MTDLQAFQAVASGNSPSGAYYRELIEQSNRARAEGHHSEAQRLASLAHKWSMDEWIRLQRLEQAMVALREARTRLETAWDKDRSCATVTELVAHHPELHRLTVICSEAEERVRLFATEPERPVAPAVADTRGWRFTGGERSRA